MSRRLLDRALQRLPPWIVDNPLFPVAVVTVCVAAISLAGYFELKRSLLCSNPRAPTPIACNRGPGRVPVDEVPAN